MVSFRITATSMSTDDLHIAIIPDGNRRWAKKRALNPWKGHEVAMENFEKTLDWCYNDPRVHTLTIWGFSTENWKRDEKEIEMLMDLFIDYLKNERQKFTEKGIRVVHSGRRDRLPKELISLIEDIEEETKDNAACTFHLAIDYGGKDEILRAVEKMDGESIEEHLDQPSLPEIDLIIRTSGEHRTSNFFLWQSAYAEWIFEDKQFPDFTPEDLERCVEEFENRKRRYGG